MVVWGCTLYAYKFPARLLSNNASDDRGRPHPFKFVSALIWWVVLWAFDETMTVNYGHIRLWIRFIYSNFFYP